MKILIVDDESINRDILERILTPYGECHMAENGVKAVNRFKESLYHNDPFDLVMLDIVMPEMDGQEALKEIRKAEHLKYGIGLTLTEKQIAFVIMVTILDDPRQFSEAFMEGKCNSYLTKPIDRDYLLDKLRKHKLIPTE